MIHQFLSPITNHRKDEYGGPLENRLRFGLEVLEVVREAVGDGFPIVVRMNTLDHVSGGLTIWDAVRIAQELQEANVDALSVTSGTMCEAVEYFLYPAGTPKAHLPPFSAQIRAAVSLPVDVAGRIRRPDWAEEILKGGQADLIGLGRPFLADPDWPRKAQSGDVETIALCSSCHQGYLAELKRGRMMSCLINPLAGHEAEIEIMPADEPREVMVVGGGLVDLEAAFVAAQRGHHVSLYEESDQLGGQFHLASTAPHKDEFFDLIRYLEVMVN
jgi:2,4-dienoyl-CoA reductase-like NADH-dependent reductase (Old Yellow Enzyme family)